MPAFLSLSSIIMRMKGSSSMTMTLLIAHPRMEGTKSRQFPYRAG
jgi:hypothetical protein